VQIEASAAVETDRTFGGVTVLVGERNGKYPHGNSILVRGRDARLIMDPSLAVVARAAELRGAADLVLLSHVHEDHIAGMSLFPDAAVHAHSADLTGLRSLDGLMQMYGAYAEEGSLAAATRAYVTETFHYCARADAQGFENGAVFDLGGCQVRVFHTPGHTRGHSALLVEPEGILFLGDIDLTSFGPYYGDAWSDLTDFERSLERLRGIEARTWVSFHQAGIVEDAGDFAAKLAAFAAKIRARDEAIVAFLEEPHSIDEMVAHRFVYRPDAQVPYLDAVEQRMITQHLSRLVAQGRVAEVEPGRYRCAAG